MASSKGCGAHIRRELAAPVGVADAALLQLAVVVARQGGDDVDAARHLVAGNAFAQFVADGLGIERGAAFGHHLRRQRLAEFIVGNADHGAVGNAGQGDQHMFDLRRVDVHAARDHHVRGAIADVEEAFLVEVAHVADADQTVAFDLARGRRRCRGS
jgi:hypothetical protein